MLRNLGSGSITLSVPESSTTFKALLYWAIIRNTTETAPATGRLNGVDITGAPVGTSGNPCWPTLSNATGGIDVFRADVTGIAVSGANTLSNFPSGLTDGTLPQDQTSQPPAPEAFPLAEGASLILIYEKPSESFKTIVINDGAQTFISESVSTTLSGFTATGPVEAATTYIVADGQDRFEPNDALFNSSLFHDAFKGSDGAATYPLDGLWDTFTTDVSQLVSAGATSVTASVQSTGRDCITYLAQVFSVTVVSEALFVEIDIKPGSFPNSINLGSGGTVPVAIFSTDAFDATTVDPTTVTLESAPVKLRGRGTPMSSSEDVDGDGLLDLVVHVETEALELSETDKQAVLEGETFSGTPIRGVDSVRIVP